MKPIRKTLTMLAAILCLLGLVATPAQAVPTFSGPLTAGRNSDGRLETFAAGGATVYHNWQVVAGGGWRGWASLGAPTADEPVTGLAVAQNADGRLEVFALTYDGKIFHTWQVTSGGWSGWASLGCCARDVVSAANADGRLEVVITGTDRVIYHRWQTTPNGAFNPDWASLGKIDPMYDLDLVLAVDGKLQVFATSGNAIYTTRQTATGWSDWASLNAPTSGATTTAIGKNADGRLEAFTLDYSGYTFHKWQNANGSWSGWESLHGGGDVGIAVGSNADGRLELFNDYAFSYTFHQWQTTPNGTWNGWWPHGGIDGSFQGSGPIVGSNADGRVELFITGANYVIYHMYQTAPNGGWSSWIPL